MAKKKKRKQKNPGQVIIPVGHPNPPEPHEVDTAMILARHFQCTVEFLVPVDDYKRKSADIVMLGSEWEIKSPTGASRSTIEKTFRRASKQAKYVVVDSRRTPLDDSEINKSIFRETARHSAIKRVILINKLSEVVEMVL
jgi:hypothetical protein